MQQHIFQFESEPQNDSEAASKASPSFTISEKLERYGTNALSVEEHLALTNIATAQEAAGGPMDSPERAYKFCLDMCSLNQEVLRVILLDARFGVITKVDVFKGSLNESLAHPREIFRAALVHSAYALVVAHNHPSGDPAPSEADIRLTRRLSEAARILQIQFVDHVIVGSMMSGR
jgi:DNA repair protein RadC